MFKRIGILFKPKPVVVVESCPPCVFAKWGTTGYTATQIRYCTKCNLAEFRDVKVVKEV